MILFGSSMSPFVRKVLAYANEKGIELELRAMGLGSYPAVNVKEARERASDAKRQVRDGVDPIEARNARALHARLISAKTATFTDCASAYIESHRAGWANPKHAAQWSATLDTYAYPVFGQLPVQAVDTTRVMKCIEPIWREKTETASRVRRIENRQARC